LAGLKETLLRYALSHRFLQQLIEGDELYTKVNANVPAPESEGWTLVLMDRASRFLWELQCGEKDCALFEQTMCRLVQVSRQTGDLSLLTDDERRYGNVLFELCRQVVPPVPFPARIARDSKQNPRRLGCAVGGSIAQVATSGLGRSIFNPSACRAPSRPPSNT
jgi:hypothetical protein